MTLKKVTKNQVKNSIITTGRWAGYLAGNRVHPYHVNGGWHLGAYVTITSIEQLENIINNFLYYLDRHLGRYVVFYEEEVKK